MSEINLTEVTGKLIGRDRNELLERRVDQVRGIIAAVVAGLEADTLSHEDSKHALIGALDLLTI